MYQITLLVHVMLAVAIIVLVLIQHGKGADIGAAFGSGASNTVFGSQGSGSFMLKLTGSLAALFFATSIGLSYMVSQQVKANQQFELPTTTAPSKIKVPSPTPKLPVIPD